MRVGLGVAKAIDPEAAATGIGVYTRELWQQFERSTSLSVVPVAGFGRGRWNERVPSKDSIHFPCAYGPSAALSMLTGSPFPGSRAMANRVDVYHATDYWIPRLRHTPVVATLHDAIALSHPEWGTPSRRRAKNALLASSAHWADAVITVSAAMVPEIVEHFGVAPEKINVVHNGISGEWFTRATLEQSASTMQRYGLAAGYILTVGTLQPRKNLGRLLTAHALLPEELRRMHPVLIVGATGWASKAEMTMIASAVDQRHAYWLQHVPAADLMTIYQNAAALALPSLYEGFGLPVIEAFASGVPVLTSNSAALREIAADAALFVEPLAVDDMADGLKRILEDQGLRAELVERGSRRARAFSWKQCAEETIEVYRRVVGTG